MIIDWQTQCEKIFSTNKLDRDDPSDNKIYFKQEIAYVRFLISRGYTYDECFQRWKDLVNGVAAQFAGDRDQLEAQFRRTYDKARSRAYAFVDRDHKINPINLYAHEIQKINSLHCEKWVKEYIMILLVYYKLVKQKKEAVEYSTTFVNWALRQSEFKEGGYKFRSYRDARKSIAQVLQTSKPRVVKFTPIKNRGKYSTYSMPNITNGESQVVKTINGLFEVKNAFELLRDDYMICSCCGTRFRVYPKTKRTMCESCYTKFRRQYKTDKDREYYYRDKIGVSGQQ